MNRLQYGWQWRLSVCLIGLCCTGTLAPLQSLKAQDWSSFRGASGLGVSTVRGLPTEWAADTNIAWKSELPGPGASSPIVFGQRIYVTCYSGYLVPGTTAGSLNDLKRHLLCFDHAHGKLLWEKIVPAALPEEERIRDHGYAASTPAADEHGVVCFFGKSGVIAFDHDGQEQWRADVGSGTNGWGSSASPVLDKKMVYINASVESQSLRALNRLTGKEVWKVDKINEAWNTPLLIKTSAGERQLVMAKQGRVFALDPNSGNEIWNCDTDINWYMVPSVVESNGVIYCLGGRSGTSSLAVRSDGKGDVTKSHRLWTTQKGSNVSSPVVQGDYLYWVNDSQGIAFCAALSSGEVVYEERLNRAGQVYASALLVDDRLYYLTRDGRTFVISASPQFSQIAVNDLRDGGVFNGTPAIDGQRLIIRSDKFLYAIGK